MPTKSRDHCLYRRNVEGTRCSFHITFAINAAKQHHMPTIYTHAVEIKANLINSFFKDAAQHITAFPDTDNNAAALKT